MKHLDEFQLVMHRYGDDKDQQRVAEHLEQCELCRAEFQRVSSLLARVSPPAIPERGPDYGSQVWLRIRDRLPESPKPRFGWLRPGQWAIAGAVAALVVAAFFAGEFYSSRRAQPMPGGNTAVTTTPGQVRERVLVVALGDHLQRSQMLLLELTHAPHEGQVDLSAEQQQAQELVVDNRLYRQTAASLGDARVTRVLDQLERVLLDVAHRPSEISEQELKEIQRQIEAQGLVFKIRVLGTKVRGRARPESPPPSKDSVTSLERYSHVS